MQAHRREAIVAKLQAHARGEKVDIKKMQGQPFYRIRVGQDRFIVDKQWLVIEVVKVGPRGDIYK